MTTDVKLVRANGAGGTVDWNLVTDALNTETVLSDPVIDFGARAKLDTVIAGLAAVLAAVQAPQAVTGPLTDAQLRAATVVTRNVDPQTIDANNTQTITNTGGTFTGAWTRTRSVGIMRLLTVIASDVALGLGGTFTFQFSEDGVTPTISEQRPISSFATVRDFDLINAGEWYRIIFTPSRTVLNTEHIFITTTLRPEFDGEFVRLANQAVEMQNAAMGHHFAYLKGFGSDGLSKNVLINNDGSLPVAVISSTSPPQVIDETGNGHTGVLVGGQYPDLILSAYAPAWADMLLFDGLDRGSTSSNQGVDCGAFGVGATNFTLEAKIDYRHFGNGSGPNQFVCGVADDTQLQVLLYVNPFNTLIAQATDAAAGTHVAFCAGVQVGKHDVAVTWDGTTLRCYLDGVKGTDAAMSSLSAYDGTTHFWIGRGGYTNNNGDPFGRGGINEVRLSNTARYVGANYTPTVVKSLPDANTLALYHLDFLYGPVNVMSQDSYGSGDLFGGQQTTSAPGQVKTFTVINGDHVDLLWVRVDDGSGVNGIGHIDPFGGTPSATAGWPCDDGIPVPLTIRTNRVKVYAAASGAKINVIGYRY